MRGFKNDDAVEAAFYHAFADCDIKAMETIWARDKAICIHPGASALLGYDVVMRSWSNILLNAQPPRLKYEVLSRSADNNLAIHVVKESIAPAESPLANAVVLATNVYMCDHNDGWLICAHHASVAQQELARPTLQ